MRNRHSQKYLLQLPLFFKRLQRLPGLGHILKDTEYSGAAAAHKAVCGSQFHKEYGEDTEKKELIDRIIASGGTSFHMEFGGEKITVFSDTILNDWYVVMVVDNKGLYAELSGLMAQSAVMCLIVFGVTVLFCFVEMNRTDRLQI